MGSDWKEHSIERQEKRHTALPEDEEEEIQKPKKKRKDTKHWCKGKKGKEHVLKCMTHEEAKGPSHMALASWRYLVCTVCGKELEVYYGDKNHLIKQERPDWVVC